MNGTTNTPSVNTVVSRLVRSLAPWQTIVLAMVVVVGVIAQYAVITTLISTGLLILFLIGMKDGVRTILDAFLAFVGIIFVCLGLLYILQNTVPVAANTLRSVQLFSGK